MKRILTVDGGGIRGVFALEILARMEALLGARTSDPERFVLADHFHLFAGTSTGAIIATCLAWGHRVRAIQEFYLQNAPHVFTPARLRDRLKYRYASDRMSRQLQRLFCEEDGRPSLLGTAKLKQLLLVVLNNLSTGSPWPLTNHPGARFNQPELPECNLKLPLWQVVRASTAAPGFFEPEVIALAGKRFVFEDGGMTPYLNPSFIAFLVATQPCYRIEWPVGTDCLRLISVGAGRLPRTETDLKAARERSLWKMATALPPALLDAMAVEQDLLCRVIGHCLAGELIDLEVGDLVGDCGVFPKLFAYARYNRTFAADDIALLRQAGGKSLGFDNVKLIPALQTLGRACADAMVHDNHLG